jgi:Chaperone of endosialidase
MGKDSGGGGTQTVVNKTELPQWVQDAGQKNLAQAYNVSANLAGPYTGPRVAGMTAGQQADIAALQNNVGSTNPAFAYAQNAAAGLTNYNPAQVNAGTLAGTDLSSYMNPYTQNVINSAMQGIDVQRQQALNQVGDQALKTGAFGGSRQGITEGITNAGAAMQAGNLAAQLQAQNYNQAVQNATNDINRNFQAQGLNQQAGLSGAGLNLSAANQLGSLASQGQQSFLQGTAAALAGQESAQQNQQAQLAAQQQAYNEAKNYPLEQLQIPLQALGATPYGQTNTQTGPGPTSNGLMQGLGALGTGVGILGGLFGPMGLFASDENLKTDIKKLGKDPQTGLDMYAYRYKGDPKSYPKVVGPMAQDIEKKYPNQVGEIGGNKVVNLGFGSTAQAS